MPLDIQIPRDIGYVARLHARRLGPIGPYNALVARLIADGQTLAQLVRDGDGGRLGDINPRAGWTDPVKALYVALRFDGVPHAKADDFCERIT